MLYVCTSCKHTLDIPAHLAGRFCPECSKPTWQRVEPAGGPAAMTPPNAPAAPAAPTGRSQTPLPLSVAFHHHIHLNAHGAALRLQLRNNGTAPVDGEVSIVTDDGQSSVSQPFGCSPVSSTNRETTEVVVSIPFTSQSVPPAAAVRIQLRHDRSRRFYEGRVGLSQPTGGSIQVTIDRSIHASTYLGGLIEEAPINIYAEPRQSEWQSLPLHYRGPLLLCSAVDRHPLEAGLLRRRPTDPATSEPHPGAPLRITLSLAASGNQPARRVHMIAGDTLRMGRAQTFSSALFKQPINDVVLRTLQSDLYHGDYISRLHGMLQRTGDDISYTDFSGKPVTRLDNTLLQPNMPPQPLRVRGVLQPGHELRKHTGRTLELHYRQHPAGPTEWLENIRLLCEDEHWPSHFSDTCGQALLLQRSDAVPESYIFMQHTLFAGTDSNLCAWQLNHAGTQPLHATIAAFNDSFWISPCGPQSSIRVNQQLLPNERLTRLRPGQSLTLGHETWTVSEWSQHILNCNCCSPHQS